MTKAEKAIEKAYKAKCKLATAYNVEMTSIIWMGGNKFIVVDNGKEIAVEVDLDNNEILCRCGRGFDIQPMEEVKAFYNEIINELN